MLIKQRQPILILVLLLAGGFVLTSLVSYFVSRASLRARISERELPLTSDNICSEIQRDLLRPILISSMMATDTFLREWVDDGEQDVDRITTYLESIREGYNTFSSFFISERTKNYYHAGGILKQVSETEKRDIWYFRVREMATDYEINVDRDMANRDAMTIFINHKVIDADGAFLGATGVGLTVDAVKRQIDNYGEKYGRSIFFTDAEGNLTLSRSRYQDQAVNIREMEGLGPIADQVLDNDGGRFTFRLDNRTVHLNSRYIPEMKWYLLVEQREAGTSSSIFRALLINLGFCALITVVVILLANMTIKAHQRKITSMEEEVKILSGLLPICAACKKVRDDQGYWNQIEEYITDHSEAQFTHGICPECAEQYYPGLSE